MYPVYEGKADVIKIDDSAKARTIEWEDIKYKPKKSADGKIWFLGIPIACALKLCAYHSDRYALVNPKKVYETFRTEPSTASNIKVFVKPIDAEFLDKPKPKPKEAPKPAPKKEEPKVEKKSAPKPKPKAKPVAKKPAPKKKPVVKKPVAKKVVKNKPVKKVVKKAVKKKPVKKAVKKKKK